MSEAYFYNQKHLFPVKYHKLYHNMKTKIMFRHVMDDQKYICKTKHKLHLYINILLSLISLQ